MSQPSPSHIRATAVRVATLRRLALSVLFTIATTSYQTTCTISERTFNKRQHANARYRVESLTLYALRQWSTNFFIKFQSRLKIGSLAANFKNIILKAFVLFKFYMHTGSQECIPIGCVPPGAVAVCCGGGVSASVHAGIPPWPGPGHNPPGVGLVTP